MYLFFAYLFQSLYYLFTFQIHLILSGEYEEAQLVEALRYLKVAGSIPDEVTGIFHWLNHSGRTMALGLTVTQMAGEGSRCLGLTKLPPSCADCPEILWTPPSCSPNGLSKHVKGLIYLDPYLYQLLVTDLNVLANSNPRFSSRSLSHFPTKASRLLRQAAHRP